MRVKQFGDNAVILEVGENISRVSHARVMNFYQAFKELQIPGVEDLIPAYTSLTIVYNPFETSLEKINKVIHEIEVTDDYQAATLVRLPVCYDITMAPDLELLSSSKDITIPEVIDLHLARVYQVYMMGFLPGFLYMGEVNDKIRMPRKATPRNEVASGSVGIADNQTGIYPSKSPGGWNIIGRCPIKLFDPGKTAMFPVEVGEVVQFYQIDKNEFETISRDKTFKIERYDVD